MVPQQTPVSRFHQRRSCLTGLFHLEAFIPPPHPPPFVFFTASCGIPPPPHLPVPSCKVRLRSCHGPDPAFHCNLSSVLLLFFFFVVPDVPARPSPFFLPAQPTISGFVWYFCVPVCPCIARHVLAQGHVSPCTKPSCFAPYHKFFFGIRKRLVRRVPHGPRAFLPQTPIFL